VKSEAELQALAESLYARRVEAIVVPFAERSIGDWKPAENHCHRNVDWWVLSHPESRAIRGWLIFDFFKTSMGLLPFVRFTAHSLVEDEDGTLHDITPSGASKRYPFIRHQGDEKEFISLVEEHQLINLDLKLE
jgi:hypothetical protein